MTLICHGPAPTAIYTLSLHDALPILGCLIRRRPNFLRQVGGEQAGLGQRQGAVRQGRSEEHTSELQSLRHLVCGLLLEKKIEPSRVARSSNRRARSRLTRTG